MGKAQEKTNDTLFEGMDKLRYAEIPISLTSILKASTKQEKLWGGVPDRQSTIPSREDSEQERIHL